MLGSGTCCGLSLAPRPSYQLRHNPGSQLPWITFAATPVCRCAPCCCKTSPAVARQSQKKRPHNASQRGRAREQHGIHSPIHTLFVSSGQDRPPFNVIHPHSLAPLYRKQIICCNWSFDLMFCESGQSKELLMRFEDDLYGNTWGQTDGKLIPWHTWEVTGQRPVNMLN